MSINDAYIRQALAREVTKLDRQLKAIEATKALIALLEDQLKTATKTK